MLVTEYLIIEVHCQVVHQQLHRLPIDCVHVCINSKKPYFSWGAQEWIGGRRGRKGERRKREAGKEKRNVEKQRRWREAEKRKEDESERIPFTASV